MFVRIHTTAGKVNYVLLLPGFNGFCCVCLFVFNYFLFSLVKFSFKELFWIHSKLEGLSSPPVGPPAF